VYKERHPRARIAPFAHAFRPSLVLWPVPTPNSVDESKQFQGIRPSEVHRLTVRWYLNGQLARPPGGYTYATVSEDGPLSFSVTYASAGEGVVKLVWDEPVERPQFPACRAVPGRDDRVHGAVANYQHTVTGF
jgi:hypothetical protein